MFTLTLYRGLFKLNFSNSNFDLLRNQGLSNGEYTIVDADGGIVEEFRELNAEESHDLYSLFDSNNCFG